MGGFLVSVKGLFLWLLVLLCLVGVVSGNLLVTPSTNDLSVEYYESHTFSLSLWNNGSLPMENLSWSNITYFSFPGNVNLSPNESKSVSFSIVTNDLFTRNFVSTLSFFYRVPISPPERVVDVNITGSGFQPSGINVFFNDTIRWVNLLPYDVELKDLGGSGFSGLVVPGNGTGFSLLGLGNYSFYGVPGGFTGSLNVSSRVGWSFAHNSADDVPLFFHVNSILPSGVLSVSLLSSNIVVDNNETYREALIEVRNHDAHIVVSNVTVRGDRWVSNFSPNGFSLNPGGIQRVLFNITPVVSFTNETNTTQDVILSVSSNNAGNTTKRIGVFVNYENLDLLNVNGSTYNLLVLGVNQTIEACSQHMDDAGYELCQLLKRFGVNNTIIREVMAQYQIPESEMLLIRSQLMKFGNVSERDENQNNLIRDEIKLLNAKTDNNTFEIHNLSLYVVESEELRNERVNRFRVVFWVLITLLLLVLGIIGGFRVYVGVNYLDTMQKARQI